MDRRNFLLSSVTAAAMTTLGNAALADEKAPEITQGGSAKTDEEAGLPPVNLIYSEQNPGRWKSKKGTHIPYFEITDRKVRVNTEHGQSESHFIVRHSLMLEDGTIVGANTFTSNDAPISVYELPEGYRGKIFATSFCNKHDLWVSETTV